MNWLHRARREIGEMAGSGPANSAERNLTALSAVASGKDLRGDRGVIAAPADQDDLKAAFEERAAIMEIDGGLSRTDAEWAARLLVFGPQTIH